MQKDDLALEYFLDVDRTGNVYVRKRGKKSPHGALPVFSTDTEDEARALILRHCKRSYGEPALYCLNKPPSSIKDLADVSDLFRLTYYEQKLVTALTEHNGEGDSSANMVQRIIRFELRLHKKIFPDSLLMLQSRVRHEAMRAYLAEEDKGWAFFSAEERERKIKENIAIEED